MIEFFKSIINTISTLFDFVSYLINGLVQLFFYDSLWFCFT